MSSSDVTCFLGLIVLMAFDKIQQNSFATSDYPLATNSNLNVRQ